MSEAKRLMRPIEGRMLAGVCAGVGRYWGLDPTLVRVIWALAFCVLGTGLLAYIVCWIVIPEE